MRRSTSPLEHATVGLVLILATTVVVVIGCFWAAQRASDRRERTRMALADDVIRVSQAQVAAERMVVVGRAYLLTKEPKLLARAQAAGAKLEQALQEFQQEPALSKDPTFLDPAADLRGAIPEASMTWSPTLLRVPRRRLSPNSSDPSPPGPGLPRV